jgi:hypothetical protein
MNVPLACTTAAERLVRPVLTPRWSVGGDDTLLGPSGLAPLDQGTVLVVDECRHGLVVLDEQGALVRRIGAEGAAPGCLRYPTHAAPDGDGGFWVTDRWNHRVQHLDAGGGFLSSFGAYGSAPGEFNEPWGISAVDDGTLVVSDRSNHRLQVFSADGALVGTCGRGGYDRSHYEGDGFKRGYVFERWGALSNRFLSHETLFCEQGYALGTLEYPQGLAACGDGRVLVADPGLGALLRCTLGGGSVEPMASMSGSRFVATNVTRVGDGLFVAAADAGAVACLLDAEGRSVCFDVPGVEHVTACALGPGSTLWFLDGWNHRIVCCDWALDS